MGKVGKSSRNSVPVSHAIHAIHAIHRFCCSNRHRCQSPPLQGVRHPLPVRQVQALGGAPSVPLQSVLRGSPLLPQLPRERIPTQYARGDARREGRSPPEDARHSQPPVHGLRSPLLTQRVHKKGHLPHMPHSHRSACQRGQTPRWGDRTRLHPQLLPAVGGQETPPHRSGPRTRSSCLSPPFHPPS